MDERPRAEGGFGCVSGPTVAEAQRDGGGLVAAPMRSSAHELPATPAPLPAPGGRAGGAGGTGRRCAGRMASRPPLPARRGRRVRPTLCGRQDTVGRRPAPLGVVAARVGVRVRTGRAAVGAASVVNAGTGSRQALLGRIRYRRSVEPRLPTRPTPPSGGWDQPAHVGVERLRRLPSQRPVDHHDQITEPLQPPTNLSKAPVGRLEPSDAARW
jgi:hypothetical protein